MSPRKLLFLTGLVLLLFGFIFFFERKTLTTAEREQKGNLVWDIPEEAIESVRLEHGGSAVDLKKSAGGWRLVKPEAYAADSAAVSDLISQLARVKRVGGDSEEARSEDYGFKSPSAKASFVSQVKGGKKETRSVEFGVDIPGTDAAAARLSGSDAVFFVPSSLANAVKKNADDFKSKEVFGSALEVVRLEVERGRGRLSASKKNAIWWLNQPLTDLADADAIQKLVGELTGLRVLEFVAPAERGNLDALGLSPPLYRVDLYDAKGMSATVDFGSTRSDGNSVYALREGQAFTVASTIVEDLSKEAVAFREPRLVQFERSTAIQVDGVFPHASFSFSRKDSGWTTVGRPVTAAAADDLLSALLEVKSRSFLEDAEAASLRSAAPIATVTVKLSAGPVWTVKLYARRGDTEATVADRPGAFLLSGDSLSKLETAFGKSAAAPTPAPLQTRKP